MLLDRRSSMAAAIAAALMLSPAHGLLPPAPLVQHRVSGVHGDGKKKRRTFKRYRVEMQHGQPGTRAKRRNAMYGRPAHGNRQAYQPAT